MGDTLKDNKSNKVLKIGTNIVLILLIIGAIQMFYDEDSTNDHLGWLFMMVFFAIKIISSFMISLKEGDKKSVFIDLGLIIFSVLLLVVTSVKYFF
ncbi:hypothetical protein P4493_06755 [Bacillus thuringiensis]|uniref:Uncharacterized protein n=4 Tax=Bacillus cereus group TaxID=86661 RepID=A0A9Q7J2T9_BACTU|nr:MULTISPECIES: hypothetical protein [Bacillus]EAO54978.1 hypothetical protein RBTH_05823 [Bacillus thuringiensis serovar israelensis ATCC 35646]MED1152294.1 hypothetical protein [Bacillus paranthracis]AFQ28544.1 hypothetical protein BTF1_21875 [Bacillus thuringiensis HD-789]AJH07286.1 putative membrane protein [Bacillus thuringiensis HD1002]AJQ61402.1 hypothetical protein SD98_24835 [Bacillus thuringiensis serovar morrisoni]